LFGNSFQNAVKQLLFHPSSLSHTLLLLETSDCPCPNIPLPAYRNVLGQWEQFRRGNCNVLDTSGERLSRIGVEFRLA
jgi:hypothetical protein